MATLSMVLFPVALRHPFRRLLDRLPKFAHVKANRAMGDTRLSGHGVHSAERHERIAAYARCGYFHLEYTAGMFVVPLDVPPD